jgi:hypothetical protein
MFAASIFQVGGVTHRCNGIPFAAFDEREPPAGARLRSGSARSILRSHAAQWRGSNSIAPSQCCIAFSFQKL